MQTQTNETAAEPKGKAKVHRRSKLATVEQLARGAKGVTIATLMKRTGWQPHTCRAVLSRLKAKSQKSEGGDRVYRVK